MKKNIFIISFLLTSLCSFACLNGETKILKNGIYIYEDHRGIVPYGHNFYNENFPKLAKELDSLYKLTKDLDYLSDKGYVLIIAGKYRQALEIYLKIEKIRPDKYETASNIGTLYELLGENKKALFWINKAIQINPKSHNGSEWLHSKILQAKIGGPKYINSNFLINTDFGKFDEPNSKLSKSERDALIKALYYQLNERVSFIKTEDPIIGLLLFELGNLVFLDKKYDDSKKVYEVARDYGFNSALIKMRINLAEWRASEALYEKINKLQTFNEYYKNLFITTLVIGAIIIILLFLVIWWMSKKMKQLRKALV